MVSLVFTFENKVSEFITILDEFEYQTMRSYKEGGGHNGPKCPKTVYMDDPLTPHTYLIKINFSRGIM